MQRNLPNVLPSSRVLEQNAREAHLREGPGKVPRGMGMNVADEKFERSFPIVEGASSCL